MWKIEKIVSKGDYNYAIVKDHPKATKNGYVLEHRIVIENQLKRLLKDDEVIHHKNGIKKDNRPETLEVLINSEHSKEHGKHVGRWYVKFKCPNCGTISEKEKRATHLGKGIGTYTACSHSCSGSFARMIQMYGRTQLVENAISENIVSLYKKYKDDNAEETATTGSVETIRIQAETPKT